MPVDPPPFPRSCIALGLAFALVGCKAKQEAGAGSDEPPQTAGSEAPGKVTEKAPNISQQAAQPPLPAGAGPAVTAPALAKDQFIAPLRDAYDRIDPAKDGWESEAFSAAALEKLHLLEELFVATDPINPALLKGIISESFASTPLRPETTSVFDDGRLRVLRAAPLPLTSKVTIGPSELIAGLNQLKSTGTSTEVHLKIFRVARKGESTVTTSVLVEIGAVSSTNRRQINATWSCDWLNSPGRPVLLSAIRLTKYEEISQESESTPLFSDATASVLDRNRCYKEQLLTSSDHWRARLPRDLGLDSVANHGLAIGDINGDDLDDLYLCQQGGLPNRMFVQDPDGTLRDITEASGTGWLDYCASALLVDLDNDGDRDLIVSQDFRMLVMSNDGSGRFALEFGTSTKAQSFSLAAADYDNDGLVDFYICGYNPSTAEKRAGAMGEPMPFHDANNGGRNSLFHNDGQFKFTDVTTRVGLDQNNTRFTFAAAWEDYDNDGDQDLYLANDYGRNCLYRNDGARFSDVAPELRVEDTSSGMSVSWSDFNHDGFMDLYTSNMFSSAGNRITYQPQFKEGLTEEVRKQFQHIALGNSLFQAAPGAPFSDVGVDAGVTMARWAWGSRFVDFNNDGHDDLLVANGFITAADTGDL